MKTMRYHYTLLKQQKKKSVTLTILNAGDGVQQQESSLIAGENTKWYNHFER